MNTGFAAPDQLPADRCQGFFFLSHLLKSGILMRWSEENIERHSSHQGLSTVISLKSSKVRGPYSQKYRISLLKDLQDLLVSSACLINENSESWRAVVMRVRFHSHSWASSFLMYSVLVLQSSTEAHYSCRKPYPKMSCKKMSFRAFSESERVRYGQKTGVEREWRMLVRFFYSASSPLFWRQHPELFFFWKPSPPTFNPRGADEAVLNSCL